MNDLRCVYVDLDSTLLGKGASLLHDGEGKFTLLGVRALEACERAGVEVVIMSGRRKVQVAEDARLVGQKCYIYEAGSALVTEQEEEFLTGEMLPGENSIHDQITATGGPELLLTHYSGRLEYHAPWHLDREITHLLRGQVDTAEAEALLHSEGITNLRLLDNGSVFRRSSALSELEKVHAYHLVPAPVSKGGAVLRHMQVRGYKSEECIAIGDSREDLGVAQYVNKFWLVANALERDPTLTKLVASKTNVLVCKEKYGAGVYEAVVRTLRKEQ